MPRTHSPSLSASSCEAGPSMDYLICRSASYIRFCFPSFVFCTLEGRGRSKGLSPFLSWTVGFQRRDRSSSLSVTHAHLSPSHVARLAVRRLSLVIFCSFSMSPRQLVQSFAGLSPFHFFLLSRCPFCPQSLSSLLSSCTRHACHRMQRASSTTLVCSLL